MSHCKTMGRQFGNANGSGQENTTLYMPVSLSECTYIHMYIHTYIHTHIHTYLHTYILMFLSM